MNSPKSRFQSVGQNAEVWRKISGEIIFEEAADAAMLQYFRNLPASDPDASKKIQGAREFLEVLTGLGDKPTEEKTKQSRKLQFDVQQ